MMIEAHPSPVSSATRQPSARAVAVRGSRAGFTIIELLVVVAIIIILLSILIVAVNAAGRTAARANTISLLNAVSQGLERFKTDIGYYPPVLGPSATPVVRLRELFNPPVLGSATYQADIQNWYSTAAIPDYLLGWGSHREDGFGVVQGQPANFDWDGESPPSGIRHPLRDGVWDATVNGAAAGLLADRMKTLNAYSQEPNPAAGIQANAIDQGRVYGPYFEIKDEGLLGSTDGTFDALGNLRVFFPGDPLYNVAGPLVLCDYWGTPIRYFRKPYPAGALGQSHRPNTDINRDGVIDDADDVPTLSDVFLLRPWTIKAEVGPDQFAPMNRFPDAGGSTATTRELDTAEFALFSPGPDRVYDATRAVDEESNPPLQNDGDGDGRVQENKDNIVEVGP